MAEILTFVNNATEIEGLDPQSSSGLILVSWEPALAPWKEITTSPLLGDGTNLLVRNFDDIIETMQFAIVGSSQNDVITKYQNFVGLLELGVAYEMGSYDYPTYIKVKPNDATNTPYGRIKKYKIDKLPQVLGTAPLSIGAIAGGVVKSSSIGLVTVALQIPWYQDVAPGNVNSTLLQSTQTYNSVVRGTVDSTQTTQSASSVYVAPKFTQANFTHIYRYDDSAGTFSSNLVASTFSTTNLFPSPLGVGDILYMGVGNAVTNSGPTSSAIFEIGTAASAAMTVVWEVGTGVGTWTPVSNPDDGTVGFSQTGQSIVTFTPPTTWIPNVVNTINAWWLRARITATNGNSTVPTQTSRNIYSATLPYATIPASLVKGEIPALTYIRTGSHLGTTDRGISRLVMGLRDVAKGNSFIPYWNCALTNDQNPSGVTVTASPVASEVTGGKYPTGRALEVDLTSTGGISDSYGPCYFTLGSSFANQYRGKFRLFFGVELGVGSDLTLTSQLKFQAEVLTSGANSYAFLRTDEVAVPAVTLNTMVIDFGEHEIIPSPRKKTVSFDDFIIKINHTLTTGRTYNYKAIFLAMIPSDEWLLDTVFTTNLSLHPSFRDALTYHLDGTNGIEADSYLATTSSGNYYAPVHPRNGRLPFIQANATQRLYVLNMVSIAGSPAGVTPPIVYDPGVVVRLSLDHVARYMTCLRGIS